MLEWQRIYYRRINLLFRQMISSIHQRKYSRTFIWHDHLAKILSQDTRKTHPMTRPSGRVMGCRSWARSLIINIHLSLLYPVLIDDLLRCFDCIPLSVLVSAHRYNNVDRFPMGCYYHTLSGEISQPVPLLLSKVVVGLTDLYASKEIISYWIRLKEVYKIQILLHFVS